MTLATAPELAAILGVDRGTIYRWSRQTGFPAARRLSSGSVWDIEEVRRWERGSRDRRRPGNPGWRRGPRG